MTRPATPGRSPRTASPDTPRAVTVDALGVPVSALVSEAAEPRAVLLALHGGGVGAGYFDYPGHPGLSLLRTGAALGFTVVAMDRPGYGAGGGRAELLRDTERRTDVAYAALDALLGQLPYSAAVFILAHSAGSELAVRMAGRPRGADLLGLELAGTGRRHNARSQAVFGDSRPGLRNPPGLREALWGPAHLYPASVYGRAPAGDSPSYEADARRWTADYPRLAARVRTPVRISLGEHETVWRSGPAALHDLAALFTAAPHVTVNEQAGSGHNLSLGHTARAYHLGVLAFAEQCLAARRTTAHGQDAGPEPGPAIVRRLP
jgi:hypothetical protein